VSNTIPESAIEYLRRAVSWLNYELEDILQDLPTTQSILEYFELWTIYDTDFLVGIHDEIYAGADPKPLIDFIEKYNLKWTTVFETKKSDDEDI
jgi:hypothetical protein